VRRERKVAFLERREDVVDAREQHHVRVEVEHVAAIRQLQEMLERERLDRRRELDDAVGERPVAIVGNAQALDAEDRVEGLVLVRSHCGRSSASAR
jgi:hypothetical protein